MSLMLATNVSPLTSSLCIESGAYCVRPLTGNLCIDSPGFCDLIDKTTTSARSINSMLSIGPYSSFTLAS